jgi:hypothetical protein
VVITEADAATPLLTKTTNITGATGGQITVAWAANDLALTPGTYLVQLKATRTADNLETTVEDCIIIRRRY